MVTECAATRPHSVRLRRTGRGGRPCRLPIGDSSKCSAGRGAASTVILDLLLGAQGLEPWTPATERRYALGPFRTLWPCLVFATSLSCRWRSRRQHQQQHQKWTFEAPCERSAPLSSR